MFILQMKSWAKFHSINSPKDRTISSMAIISLVAFHLQVNDFVMFDLTFIQPV
jgi:DNA polymerase sigma